MRYSATWCILKGIQHVIESGRVLRCEAKGIQIFSQIVGVEYLKRPAEIAGRVEDDLLGLVIDHDGRQAGTELDVHIFPERPPG